MFAKPQAEHEWLEQLVGDWSLEHTCQMPDSPDDAWSTIMTLGFDPAKNQYVGTFIGSMAANIWPYLGVVDATNRRLPLYSEGPKFDGTGIGKYRDTIEIIDADTWLFSSELESADGSWLKFMSGKHTRS